MGEAAPRFHEETGDTNMVSRRFELIVNELTEGPEGPFFVRKWDQSIDARELVDRRPATEKEQKEGIYVKPPIQDGRGLILAIFQQVGVIHEKQVIDEFKQGRSSLMGNQTHRMSDQEQNLFAMLDRLINFNETTRIRINTATETYQREYWEDYQKKKGQDVDKLTELYDQTEDYEESGLLSSIRAAGIVGMSSDIVYEADRIARIMIVNEIERTN